MTRAEEKQASRDADAKALATGEKTREDLWRENSFVPAWVAKAPLSFEALARLPKGLWKGRAARLPKR